jgi:hypothetical protein
VEGRTYHRQGKGMDTKIKTKIVSCLKFGGEAGIRTLGGVTPTTVFPTRRIRRGEQDRTFLQPTTLFKTSTSF